VLAEDDTTIERIDTLQSPDKRTRPDHAAAVGDAKSRFRAAFQQLPQRQREVAILLYVEELTLREIGEVLGVSESRVSQIHSDLRRSLRKSLSAHAALLSEVA
jgi:RNA polymerase sigma factor for flagellar operon FliA